MSTPSTIALRPRFKIELKQSNEAALKAFEDCKTAQTDYIISRIDDHVFIKFPKAKQHFWSPQLHLEINETDENTSTLHGLFGPNPTVWTLFMFLHFIVVLLFITAGIWAYSNWTLETPYTLQLGAMVVMTIAWFALYFIGRMGKATGKDQMHDLYNFMITTLKL